MALCSVPGKSKSVFCQANIKRSTYSLCYRNADVVDMLYQKRGKIYVDEGWNHLLVGNEHFKRADDLCQRDCFVGLPVLCGFDVVNEDDEVLVLAFIVDLGLLCFSANHVCFVLFGEEVRIMD